MRLFRTIASLALLAAWFAGPFEVSANGGLYGMPLGAATDSTAERSALRIEIVGGDSLTVDPGDVVTVVYRVSDPEGVAGTYTPEFDLPKGWSIVFGGQPLEISESAPVTRFVSYKIPGSELAGAFHPRLRLLDSQSQAVAVADALIQVDSILDLAFEAGTSPTYVAAGAAFNVSFELVNKGNTPVTIDLEAQDRKFVKVELPKRRVSLQPGEFLTFEARITTDADLDHSQRASLRFDARLAGDKSLNRYATVAFDVVPVYARMKPKAANTPLSLAVETVGDERGVTPQASIRAQGEVLGGQLTVQATLSEMPRQKFFGQERSFTARYDNESVSVTVGDHQEQFSPMTLTGERGVGVAASVRGDKWQVKGTAQQSRSVFPVQQRAGVSAMYRTSNTSNISANLLHRNEFYRGTVLTVRSLSNPFGASSKLDAECGISNQQSLADPSCVLQFSNSSPRLSYRIQAQHASNQFPGTLSGARTVSSYAAYRISSHLRVDQTSSYAHRSLGDGYGRDNLMVKAGMTYSARLFGGSLYASAHGLRTSSSYAMIRGSAERSENILRVTSGYQLPRIGFTVLGEEGRASDASGSDGSHFRRWKTNARVSPLDKWNLNASMELSSGNLSAMAAEQKQVMYGLGSTVTLPGDIRASVTAFRSVIETHMRQQYASIRGSVAKTFRSGRVLSARVQFNHNEGRQSLRTADYRIGFETPLAVPFTNRRGEDDILRGRIVDHASGQPVADVLVMLGNDLAITDKQGRFRFGRPGQDIVFLRVDAASLGYDKAPMIPMPMQVGPEHYTGEEMIISVARTASVTGQLEVYGREDSDELLIGAGEGALVRRSGFYGAVIQIESATLRYRTRTGRDGAFAFTQLPPDTYTVSVLQADIDDYQRVERSEVKVTLDQGEDKPLAFSIVPARKTIRMIQSSSLSIGAPAVVLPKAVASPKTVAQPNAPKTFMDHTRKEHTKNPAPTEPFTGSVQSDSTTSLGQPAQPESIAPASAPARVGGKRSSAPWIDMLKGTARVRNERAGADDREGSSIPWMLMRQGPQSPQPRPLHGPLFVLCMLFLILYVDIVFRQLVVRRPTGVIILHAPAWTLTARFAWYYGSLITWALFWGGPLMGLAATMAFSGISVAIESRQIYQSIWNVCRFVVTQRAMGGVWVRYRDTAIHVDRITVEALIGTQLDGSSVHVPTHRIHELTDACRKSNGWEHITCTITFSRHSDLHRVRQVLTDALTELLPSGAPRAHRIAFRDSDASWTRAEIAIVGSANHIPSRGVSELLAATLRTDGVFLQQDATRSHLRLVQIRRAA